VIDGPDDITADWLTTAPARHHARRAGTVGRGRADRDRPDRCELPAAPRCRCRSRRRAPTDPRGEDPQRRDRRSVSVLSAGYRNEIGFYTVFRDRVQIRTPRAGTTEISDDSSPHSCCLLDDLAPARPGVQVDGCSADQAVDAVRKPRRAARAGVETTRCCRNQREWLSHADGEAGRVPRDHRRERSRGVHRLATPTSSGTTSTRCADRRSSPGAGRRRPPARPRWCHGDYRLDNLMFPDAGARDGAGVVTVDWQTLAIGPPARRPRVLPRHQPACRRAARARACVGARVRRRAVSARSGSTTTRTDRCFGRLPARGAAGTDDTMIGAAYATAERSASADAMFLAMATRGRRPRCATSTRSALVEAT